MERMHHWQNCTTKKRWSLQAEGKWHPTETTDLQFLFIFCNKIYGCGQGKYVGKCKNIRVCVFLLVSLKDILLSKTKNGQRFWEKWPLIQLLVEVQNDTATWVNNLTVSHHVKHIIIIWPSNPIPRYFPKRSENICSHEDLYLNVHSNFIRISPKPAPKFPSRRWINCCISVQWNTTQQSNGINCTDIDYTRESPKQ